MPNALRAWRSTLQPNGVLGLSTAVAADEDEGREVVPYGAPFQRFAAPLPRWFAYDSPARLLTLLR